MAGIEVEHRIGTEAAGKPNKREQGAKRTTKPMTSKQVVLGQKKRDYVNNPGSHIERRFLADIEAAGLPLPVTEYEFCPGRKWRIDAAYPEQKIAIELEGGMWQGGRHTNPLGYMRDCEKYNTLALMGWRLLRFPAIMVEGGKFTRKRQRGGEVYRVQERVEPCAVELVRQALAIERKEARV